MEQSKIMGFGQSQSPKARAKLIEIVRTEKDAKAREQAILWLGQMKGEDMGLPRFPVFR
jgi:hypothetical protein